MAESATLVANARTVARRRLVGAVLLLGIGVIAFPLLFETQPRPIPVDIAIEIPRKEGAPALALPPPRQPAAAPASAALPAPAAASSAAPAPPVPMITERKAETVAPASAPTARKPEPVAAKAEPAAAKTAKAESPAAPEGEGRFVVQVGAYADAGLARETRIKLEKMGLRTYTQVVDTEGGKRTRVRLGPYAARDEADKAAAQVKAAGLPAAVLTL